MKNLCFIIFILISYTSSAQNKKAISKYQEHLTIIKNASNSQNVDLKSLNESIEIIENLTKIRSYEDSSDYGNFKMPVSYNIKDWELWIEKNKLNIIFQNHTNKLIANNAKPLVKKPIDLFKSYINDLKKMKKTENYIVHEIDYILNNLEKLTKIKFTYNENCACRFPTKSDFDKIDKWFKKNGQKLSWNKRSQQIEIIQ